MAGQARQRGLRFTSDGDEDVVADTVKGSGGRFGDVEVFTPPQPAGVVEPGEGEPVVGILRDCRDGRIGRGEDRCGPYVAAWQVDRPVDGTGRQVRHRQRECAVDLGDVAEFPVVEGDRDRVRPTTMAKTSSGTAVRVVRLGITPSCRRRQRSCPVPLPPSDCRRRPGVRLHSDMRLDGIG